MGFNKIISQEKAVKLLKGTLKTKKIPNAFLFIGDSYIGKTETAFAYARAVNCLNPNDYDCCNICPSCKKIDLGVHPDVKIVVPEKDVITVSNIREVEEFVFFKPLEGKYKVVIVKEAHKMNAASANAFLKTVEEPPLDTTIILICENIHSLPEPLISRCFKIHFTPLSTDAVRKIIPEIPEKENFIRIIMGRPGFFVSKNILKDIQWFADTLKNINDKKKSLWKENEEIKWWIDFLCIFLRDQLVQNLKKNSYTFCPILPLNFRLKKGVTVEQIFDFYEELQKVRRNIDLNLNKSIVWNYLSCLVYSLIETLESLNE